MFKMVWKFCMFLFLIPYFVLILYFLACCRHVANCILVLCLYCTSRVWQQVLNCVFCHKWCYIKYCCCVLCLQIIYSKQKYTPLSNFLFFPCEARAWSLFNFKSNLPKITDPIVHMFIISYLSTISYWLIYSTCINWFWCSFHQNVGNVDTGAVNKSIYSAGQIIMDFVVFRFKVHSDSYFLFQFTRWRFLWLCRTLQLLYY